MSGSGSGATYHIRITHNDKGFSINDAAFPSLVDLIEQLGPSLHLHTPCEVSKYQAIFSPLEQNKGKEGEKAPPRVDNDNSKS